MKKEKEMNLDPGAQLAVEMRAHAKLLLEQAARLAKGTQDVTAEARAITTKSLPYHVGDEGPTPELMSAVEHMLQDHPMTFQEILDMTGARPNRVKGVITRLQRDGKHVVNLGTEARAIWFMPSEDVWKRLQVAKLRATSRKR